MAFSEPTVHNVVSIAVRDIYITSDPAAAARRVSAAITFLQWHGEQAKLEFFADISMADKFQRWAKATREIFEEEA